MEGALCDCGTAVKLVENKLKQFVGRECEIEVMSEDYCPHISSKSFCVNGGTCCDVAEEPCECRYGYTGPHCQYELEEVQSPCLLACSNQGACQHGVYPSNAEGANGLLGLEDVGTSNFMYCVCNEGYAGANCEVEVVKCEEDEGYCFHGSTCTRDPEGTETCECSNSKSRGKRKSWHFPPCENTNSFSSLTRTITLIPVAGEYCEFMATDDCEDPIFIDEVTATESFHPTKKMTSTSVPFCVNDGICYRTIDTEDYYCGCDDVNWSGPRCGTRVAQEPAESPYRSASSARSASRFSTTASPSSISLSTAWPSTEEPGFEPIGRSVDGSEDGGISALGVVLAAVVGLGLIAVVTTCYVWREEWRRKRGAGHDERSETNSSTNQSESDESPTEEEETPGIIPNDTDIVAPSPSSRGTDIESNNGDNLDEPEFLKTETPGMQENSAPAPSSRGTDIESNNGDNLDEAELLEIETPGMQENRGPAPSSPGTDIESNDDDNLDEAELLEIETPGMQQNRAPVPCSPGTDIESNDDDNLDEAELLKIETPGMQESRGKCDEQNPDEDVCGSNNDYNETENKDSDSSAVEEESRSENVDQAATDPTNPDDSKEDDKLFTSAPSHTADREYPLSSIEKMDLDKEDMIPEEKEEYSSRLDNASKNMSDNATADPKADLLVMEEGPTKEDIISGVEEEDSSRLGNANKNMSDNAAGDPKADLSTMEEGPTKEDIISEEEEEDNSHLDNTSKNMSPNATGDPKADQSAMEEGPTNDCGVGGTFYRCPLSVGGRFYRQTSPTGEGCYQRT